MDLTSVILFAVIAVLISDTTALRCYECKYFRPTTGNAVTDLLLGAVDSQMACQDISENEANGIAIETCSSASSGNVMKCAAIKGEISTRVTYAGFDLPVELYTVLRGCIEVPRNHDSRCLDNLSPATTNYIQSLIENEVADVELGAIEFSDGNACYADETLTDDTFRGDSNGGIMNSYSITICISHIAAVIVYIMIL